MPPDHGPMNDELLSLKLDHLQSTLDEVKSDVREIKAESPVLRIRQLEEKWKNLSTNVSRLAIGLAGAVATSAVAIWFTR